MKKRLMISNVVIIAAGFFAAFLLVALMVQSQYRDEFRKRLDATLAVAASQEDIIRQDPQAFAHLEKKYLSQAGQEIRLTIIALDGTVLGDSDGQLAEDIGENHLNRPEIIEARQNGYGYDMRTSTSVDKPFYYAALYLPDFGYLRAALPMSDYQSVVGTMWAYALLGMSLGIVLVCLVTWGFVSRLLDPLRTLTVAARKIAAGNFSSRAEGKFQDEIEELACSFNQMADNTESAVRELQSKQKQLESVLQGMDHGVLAIDRDCRLLFLNESARILLNRPAMLDGDLLDGNLLIRDISSLMKQSVDENHAIRETVRDGDEKIYTVYASPISGPDSGSALAVISDVTRVRRLEQLRSEFVANVTHELKTPLTSIRGSIELLKSADRDEETRKYFYDVLDIEAERLHHLIDDMLVLSQIENAKEDPSVTRCCVKQELLKTVQRLKPLAERNHISIECNLDDSLFVDCSPSRLQQLFGNLIENGIKYNKPEGKILITALRQRQMAVIRFRDTGIGIEQRHLPRLFERFYRVDTSRSREIGGTGLGLSIVKHLCALYHGDVSVDSTPGVGSTFTVRLPLSPKS